MTSTAETLPDTAPLPGDLLVQVRAERRAADAAEVRILQLAVEFAHANPALPGQEAWQASKEPALPSWEVPDSDLGVHPEDVEWHGIPPVRWDAPAAFAAANAMSTTAGKALLRDALLLAHRAPGTWGQVDAGRLPAWRARKVAQALVGQPDDVCVYLDQEVVNRIADHGTVGPIVLERLLDEALLRLHAEERELDQLTALDARHVTIDAATINHTGIADLQARADWADLSAFDDTVAQIAEVLKHLPEHEHESLDVRRSLALGILADPARAQALLQGDLGARPSRTRTRDLVAYLHLTEANLLGLDPVMTDADQKAHLDQVIRTWAGRRDINLIVKPLQPCATATTTGCVDHPDRLAWTYAPTALAREVVALRDRTCVHPYCTRPAAGCDLDHITPFDSGGPTCPHCNLAPLCRHHHRLKTLAGWRYWKLATPSTYLWRDPHWLIYLRQPEGTHQLD